MASCKTCHADLGPGASEDMHQETDCLRVRLEKMEVAAQKAVARLKESAVVHREGTSKRFSCCLVKFRCCDRCFRLYGDTPKAINIGRVRICSRSLRPYDYATDACGSWRRTLLWGFFRPLFKFFIRTKLISKSKRVNCIPPFAVWLRMY